MFYFLKIAFNLLLKLFMLQNIKNIRKIKYLILLITN